MTAGNVQLPGNQQVMTPVMLPCMKERCQLWDTEEGVCCYQSANWELSQIVANLQPLQNLQLLQHLEPPKDGSPLMRIADALETIVKSKKEK
jgi:hypothetical protein